MLTAAVEYPAAIAASACRTSAAVSSRSFRAPMTARIGSKTFWFLVTVLELGIDSEYRCPAPYWEGFWAVRIFNHAVLA